MLRYAVGFAAVVLVGSTVAHGQTATITLRTIDDAGGPGGRFLLTASVSPGHSFGIASYSVELLGAFTFDHLTPGVTAVNGSAGDGRPAGFTVFRTPDLPGPAGGLTVSASQDTVTPTPYLYFGVGQAPLDVVDDPTNGPVTLVTPGDATQDDAFLSELVIGEGAYPGTPPTINPFGVDNGVQVFTSNTGTDTTAATLVLDEVDGPAAVVGASVQVAAAVSFPTLTDTLYEVIAIDTEAGETVVGQVAGDGSTATVADLVNLPLDASLKYEARIVGGGTVTPTVQVAAAVSFETMAGKLYEVISIDASGNERVVGRAAGDGSVVAVADLDHLPLAASRKYRVVRLN